MRPRNHRVEWPIVKCVTYVLKKCARHQAARASYIKIMRSYKYISVNKANAHLSKNMVVRYRCISARREPHRSALNRPAIKPTLSGVGITKMIKRAK